MINRKAFMWLALSFFGVRKNSIVPELVITLEPTDALKLLRIMEGKTVKFPSLKELSKDMKTSLCVYHIVVEGKTWEECEELYDLNGFDIRSMKVTYNKWLKFCNDNNLDPYHMFKRAEDIEFKE